MLAALLTILKIAGIVLLVILAIVLAAILLILFVPIRYGAKASYEGRPLANAKATWLLHLVSFRADYEDDLTYSLRVLGINIFRNKAEEKAGEEMAKSGKEMEKAGPPEEITSEKVKEETVTISETETSAEGKDTMTLSVTEISATEEYHEEVISEEEPSSQPRSERPASLPYSIISVIRRLFGTVRDFFAGLCDRVSERVRYFRTELWPDAMEKKDQLIWLLRDPANVATRHLLWRQLKKLLNHIKPREVEGDVKFGFDDPYLTGQVLVAISPFYGLYGEHFNVIPVFGETVAEGNVSLKGRVRISAVLAVVIRMMMDRNFRSLLDKFLNS